MPAPNPNECRPTSSGETPLQPAPPVPGAAALPSHPEQRLGPAPALPVRGGAAAGGAAAERPLAHAPLPARPALAVPQIPAAPAVPLPRPGRPGPQESPLRPVTGGPIGSRPEVPLARPGEVRGAAWGTPSAVPLAGQAPAVGVAMPVPNPTALYGVAGVGAMPAATVGQPSAPSMPGQSQPTPPSGPAWFQPPANPPPVPPPSAGSQPTEPPPPRPIAWSPHARSGPVGSGVSAALSGNVQPASAKTSTAKSLRRESRARSSVLAVTFLLVAATFLIGMVVILLISLAS